MKLRNDDTENSEDMMSDEKDDDDEDEAADSNKQRKAKPLRNQKKDPVKFLIKISSHII